VIYRLSIFIHVSFSFNFHSITLVHASLC
jgi:hypothetical protein